MTEFNNYYARVSIASFKCQGLELIYIILYCTDLLVIYCSFNFVDGLHNSINQEKVFPEELFKLGLSGNKKDTYS